MVKSSSMKLPLLGACQPLATLDVPGRLAELPSLGACPSLTSLAVPGGPFERYFERVRSRRPQILQMLVTDGDLPGNLCSCGHLYMALADLPKYDITGVFAAAWIDGADGN